HKCTTALRMYISIPYGAIKRYISLALNQAAAIFQFLMVRLKVRKNICATLFKCTFQFLMVRLKAVAIAF
ncbi:MAG: hypothetical protein WBJ26_05945, partial [Bacteroidales bacterium]